MTTTTVGGARPSTDPNLRGNNAPVHRELDVIDLSVSGELPDDLAGVYMRNGPNPAFEPASYTYPFDGDGMIHAVYFDSGRARYRNRWVLTPGLRAELRAGRPLYGGLMHPTMPDPELVGPDGDPGPLKNVANTNVVRHAGHILALYEAGLPMELDRDLHTVGTFTFGGRLVESMTAHPKSDPITGDLHFFRYAVHEPFLTYYRADSSGRIVQRQPIDMPAPPFMHDFAITESSIVFVDTPAKLDVEAVSTGSGSMLAWHPDLGTRIGVLPRDCSRPPTWVSTEPFFVYHFLNAHDDGPVIHIDLVRHGSPPFAGRGIPPHLHRVSVDTDAGSVRHTTLSDGVVEFPRLDDRSTGQPYTTGYTTWDIPGRSSLPQYQDALAQHDLSTGRVQVHDFGEGRFPGEASFVPRPGSTNEHDGYVVTYVYDAHRDASDLAILAADQFADKPLATIHIPVRVPNGLHGCWLPLEETP